MLSPCRSLKAVNNINIRCRAHQHPLTSASLLLLWPCRFPDFSLLSPTHDYNSVIDAVFISHFHMDHVGALPYFTEVGPLLLLALECCRVLLYSGGFGSCNQGDCISSIKTEQQQSQQEGTYAVGPSELFSKQIVQSAMYHRSSWRCNCHAHSGAATKTQSPPLLCTLLCVSLPGSGVWLQWSCVHDTPHTCHRPYHAA